MRKRCIGREGAPPLNGELHLRQCKISDAEQHVNIPGLAYRTLRLRDKESVSRETAHPILAWVRNLVDGKAGARQVQARYRECDVLGQIPKSLRYAFPVSSHEELNISTQNLGLQSAKSVKPMGRLGVGV